MTEQQYDVLIAGAGPVGLVLAYHLSHLGHSVCIIDAVDKSAPGFPMYGRACVLYSRSLEILDQFGLYDDLSQIGFASDQTWGYKDGERINRKWGIFDAPESKMDTTFFKTILHIRLKHSEDIFRRRIAEKGVHVRTPAELVELQLNSTETDDYKVAATYKFSGSPDKFVSIKSRYIVGCDGAGSAVRSLAGIPFTGERKIEYWVRIDGVVQTDVPEARFGLGAFESSTHGHVVWVPLDHGATRVGYVLNEQLFQKYGTKMTAEDAAYEAQQAVAPFKLDYKRIDWHTVYGIQQHVTASYHSHGGRVLLAGDAAHTHSSGSGQGMNAGIQDVVNLSWRLAGVLKRWYRDSILENYSVERRPVAQQLIDNDKTISTLISQRKPDHLQHRPEHPHVLLDEFLRQNSGFTVGLSIGYGSSILNDIDGSETDKATAVGPGQRLPDSLLQRSGIAAPKIRLYEIFRNNGKFRVLIFTGRSDQTAEVLPMLREHVNAHMSMLERVVDFFTILPGEWHAFDERLGIERFGMAYWDPDMSVHGSIGVSTTEGAIIIVRPDEIVGLVTSLGNFGQIAKYFERILIPTSSVTK